MLHYLKKWLSRPPPPGGVREVWRIAMPIMISMASLTIMQFCDRFFLARYSEVAFRAALPAGALAFTLTTFFQTLAGYAGTFVAQYHGAKRKTDCVRATEQGIWLALITWPLGIAIIPFGISILERSGHAPDLLAAEKIYLTISILGCGVFALHNAVAGFFSGRGDTRIPMCASILGSILNIGLDYLLIFGRLGFPEWGIAGAAIATITSGAISTAFLFVMYWRKAYRNEYGTWPLRRPSMRYGLPLLRFGLPHAVHSVQDVGGFALFTVLIAKFSAADAAVSTMAFSINNLAFMPLLGMGIASTILVGQYQGARNSATAQRAGQSALKLGWAIMSILAAAFILFPNLFLTVFSGDKEGQMPLAEVAEKGRWLLLMMGVWGIADCVNLVIAGALKGAGDTRFVLLYSLCMTWLLWIPGEWILINHMGLGLLPAWGYMTFFTFILAIGLWWRWKNGAWKKIEMVEQKPLIPMEA